MDIRRYNISVKIFTEEVKTSETGEQTLEYSLQDTVKGFLFGLTSKQLQSEYYLKNDITKTLLLPPNTTIQDGNHVEIDGVTYLANVSAEPRHVRCELQIIRQ